MHMVHNIARPIVVKIGGNALDAAAERRIALEAAALKAEGHPLVVVHGGGPEIDAALEREAVKSVRVDGLRVTDPATLAVTERVLCGTLNKRLVRVFLNAGVPAVGLSGIDGALLQAHAIDRSRLGFVGRVGRVNPAPLLALLAAGLVPIVAPLAYDPATGGTLNVNADTSAAAIASALNARDLLLVTNVDRVRSDAADASSGMALLDLASARRFAESAGCQGSMKPKLQAAIDAVGAGVERALIGGSTLKQMLEGDATVLCA